VKAIVRLAGAQVGMSSCYCGSKVRSFRQWAAANCAVPPTASTLLRIAGLCCSGFPVCGDIL